jgi:hypothetical protein
MEFLQNIDLGTAAIALCGLCIVGIVLLFAFQLIGGVVEALGSIFEFFTGILSAGPLEACGCFLFIGGCGVCALLVVLVANGLGSCETNPTNFCALFGR